MVSFPGRRVWSEGVEGVVTGCGWNETSRGLVEHHLIKISEWWISIVTIATTRRRGGKVQFPDAICI